MHAAKRENELRALPAWAATPRGRTPRGPADPRGSSETPCAATRRCSEHGRYGVPRTPTGTVSLPETWCRGRRRTTRRRRRRWLRRRISRCKPPTAARRAPEARQGSCMSAKIRKNSIVQTALSGARFKSLDSERGLGLGKRDCARANSGSCTHFDARLRVQAHQQVVVLRSDLTSLKLPKSTERLHADTQVVENGFGRRRGRRSRIGRGWNRQLRRTLPAPRLAALNACVQHASLSSGRHLLAPDLLGALGAGDLVPAAGLSLEGGRRECAELAAVGRREWPHHAPGTFVRPAVSVVARPSLRPAHHRRDSGRTADFLCGALGRPFSSTQQFIIRAIGALLQRAK